MGQERVCARGTGGSLRDGARLAEETSGIWEYNEQLTVGWHTGTVQVHEVQTAPVPTKPVPVAGFTCTCTTTYAGFRNTARYP